MTTQQRCFNTATYPLDVAVDDEGFLYVALYSQHCIDVLDQQGTVIRTIGTRGSYGVVMGKFNSPIGVAVQGDVLYVADFNNHRVQKLTTSGEFLSKFGTQDSGDGQLNGPHGICIDAGGRIFVSNKRVSVFEPCGTFAYHITHNTFSNPWGMAFDLAGNLHVVDFNNHTVSIFNIHGVAMDKDGYVYICSYSTNQVLKY